MAPRLPGEPVYVVDPRAAHTHTFILLHGLGSNGQKFGSELLETGITSSGCSLTELFPGARFVFPTSKRRRSTAFGRSMLTQWFDIAILDDPSIQRDRQLQGLSESVQEILAIIKDELQHVSAQNLILGGLSQGCATSLAVLLCLDHPVGGYIGMSGFLTYQADLDDAVADDEDFDDDDPFARSDDDDDGGPPKEPSIRAQTFMRDLLLLDDVVEPTIERTASSTPVFLGHGAVDEKVPVGLGEAAARVVQNAGYQVGWKAYADQGHWYKIPDQIDDIVSFIVSRAGWKSSISDVSSEET